MQNKAETSGSSFLVLVSVLVIPFLILEALFPTELLPGLPLSALGAFTPALAALILTYKHEGAASMFPFLQRSLDFQRVKNMGWFLLILLINPAIAMFAFGIMRASGVPIPNPVSLPLVVFSLFVAFLISALGEEIGWTAYATERLLPRLGILSSGLFVGVIWSVIHFIPLIQAHRSLAWIAWWCLGTISYRLIMTWLYVHSGRSLFGVAIFHAMINLSWQLFPVQGSYYDPQIFSLLAFAVTVILYAIERFLSPPHRTLTKFQTRSSQ
jgi:membrane protease YdiL (CAAX protease family)